MRKYWLIGIPDCGKATLGELAAQHLQISYYNTDMMTMSRIFTDEDMYYFPLAMSRLFYKEQIVVVSDLAKDDSPAIIATGAEVGLMPDCVEVMRSMGTIIHLRRDADMILEELKTKNTGGMWVDVKEGTQTSTSQKALEEYAKELERYELVADYSMDNNGSVQEGLEKLISLIQTIETQLPQGEDPGNM